MSQKYVSVVTQFFDQGSDKPLGVGFYLYAVVVFLPRDHPRYKKWLALLEKSYKKGIKLRFAYSVEQGQVLTYLEEVK